MSKLHCETPVTPNVIAGAVVELLEKMFTFVTNVPFTVGRNVAVKVSDCPTDNVMGNLSTAVTVKGNAVVADVSVNVPGPLFAIVNDVPFAPLGTNVAIDTGANFGVQLTDTTGGEAG